MAGVQRRLVERWDAAAWLEVVGRNQGLYTKNLCTWVEVAKRQEAQGKPTKNYLRPDIWLVSAVNSTLIVISLGNEDWKSCQGRCLEWEERSNACPCDNYTWGEDDRSDWILLILSLCLWELFPIWIFFKDLKKNEWSGSKKTVKTVSIVYSFKKFRWKREEERLEGDLRRMLSWESPPPAPLT